MIPAALLSVMVSTIGAEPRIASSTTFSSISSCPTPSTIPSVIDSLLSPFPSCSGGDIGGEGKGMGRLFHSSHPGSWKLLSTASILASARDSKSPQAAWNAGSSNDALSRIEVCSIDESVSGGEPGGDGGADFPSSSSSCFPSEISFSNTRSTSTWRPPHSSSTSSWIATRKGHGVRLSAVTPGLIFSVYMLSSFRTTFF
mmetsp:Transcript_5349/g.13656  ORF Transcript_5349/g.13656 Transcript_5349/m.13656 type:complete len:200 (-) Transcript_5349:128-727(-)